MDADDLRSHGFDIVVQVYSGVVSRVTELLIDDKSPSGDVRQQAFISHHVYAGRWHDLMSPNLTAWSATNVNILLFSLLL